MWTTWKPVLQVTLVKYNFSNVHQGVFAAVLGGKAYKRKGLQDDGGEKAKNKRSRQSGKDEEFYIPYRPKDFNSERG